MTDEHREITSEQFAALDAAVAQLPDLYPHIEIDVLGVQAVDQEANIALTAPIEANLPEVSEQVLNHLGIRAQDGEVDEEATVRFRDQDTVAGRERMYQVITGNEGAWLLKAPQYGYDRGIEGVSKNLWKLTLLRSMQGEAQAYRVAAAMGYPIAETRLVQYEGEPQTAYRYLEGAQSFSSEEAEATPEQTALASLITNPNALKARPLFNALIGAVGDASHQGIVDEDGTYYANDIGMNVRHGADWEIEGVALAIGEEFEHQNGFGEKPVPDDEATIEFFTALDQVTEDVAREVFRDAIGSAEQREQLARGLMKRKAAMQLLREQNLL